MNDRASSKSGKYLVIAIAAIALAAAIVGLLLRPSPQRAREIREGTEATTQIP